MFPKYQNSKGLTKKIVVYCLKRKACIDRETAFDKSNNTLKKFP